MHSNGDATIREEAHRESLRQTSNRGPEAALIDRAAYELSKRVFDTLVAASALLLLTPFFALIAVLVKLTSKGPMFFRSKVAGHQGSPFTLYKFRTMVPDAYRFKSRLEPWNEADWPMFKMRRDPRVTKLGQILRKYSLDELPQLWNIVRGDMSLVGPRPVLLDEWRHFTPQQKRKLAVRPGAVSLWHLRGQPRDLDTWLALDFEYQRRRSFAFDLYVLMGGLLFILGGRNC